MRLGGDFYVGDLAARLRDGQAVLAQAFDMEFDRFTDLPFSLLHGITHGDATRKVGDVRTIVPLAFFDHNRISHVVPRAPGALRCYRRERGARVKRAPSNDRLEPLIFLIRGCRVLLDADLARLYGIDTKRFNEAFTRNRRRFPGDFAFQLTQHEFDELKSRLAGTTGQVVDSLRGNWSQFATSSAVHRGGSYRPWAFTEHGALMAANILRSDRAVQMSVFVVRAFIRLREHVAANTAVMARLAEIDKTLLQHDSALRDVYRKLLPLLQPPADPPKRRIGFHREDD